MKKQEELLIGAILLHIETLQRHAARMIRLRDEQDKDGVRALIEIQKDECRAYSNDLYELKKHFTSDGVKN